MDAPIPDSLTAMLEKSVEKFAQQLVVNLKEVCVAAIKECASQQNAAVAIPKVDEQPKVVPGDIYADALKSLGGSDDGTKRWLFTPHNYTFEVFYHMVNHDDSDDVVASFCQDILDNFLQFESVIITVFFRKFQLSCDRPDCVTIRKICARLVATKRYKTIAVLYKLLEKYSSKVRQEFFVALVNETDNDGLRMEDLYAVLPQVLLEIPNMELAMHHAIHHDNLNTMRFYAKHFKEWETEKRVHSILITLCKSDKTLDIVKQLHQLHKVNFPEMKNAEGDCVSWAAYSAAPKMLEFLLQAFPSYDVNDRRTKNRTLLDEVFLVVRGAPPPPEKVLRMRECVEILLKAGADYTHHVENMIHLFGSDSGRLIAFNGHVKYWTESIRNRLRDHK